MTKRVLLATEDVRVAVCRYAAGERHAPHTDRHSRISFVLQGGYREESRPGTVTMGPGDVLLKAHRAKHDDEFGETTLVAIEFLSDDPFDATPASALWRKREDGFALRHATTFLEAALGGDARGAATAGIDLVAATAIAAPPRRGAPSWLKRLREELTELSLGQIDVSARARDAGVHPAHASRLFRRCYGASVSEHAQTQSVRRALGALAQRSAPLAEVAAATGFYDQSHMTRVFRRVIGRTPGAARALIAAAG